MIEGFPGAVQIGAVRYRIEQYHGAGGSGWAELDVANGRIRVQTNWGVRTAAIGLLHEILHGCWRDSPLIKAQAEGTLTEEKVVEWLGFALSATMKANSALFTWLVAVNVKNEPLRMADLSITIAADAPAPAP